MPSSKESRTASEYVFAIRNLHKATGSRRELTFISVSQNSPYNLLPVIFISGQPEADATRGV